MSSLTELLRESTGEICACVDANGAAAIAIASDLDALLRTLDGDAADDRVPVSVSRVVGTAVLDWLETRDVALGAREFRIIHEWICRGSTLRIRELTEASERAARSEERVRVVLSNARIQMGEIDRNLGLRWIQDLRLLPKDLVLEQGIRDFSPSFADELAVIVDRVIQNGVGERIELSPPTTATVREGHLLVWLEPTRDADGTVTGVIGAAMDVTELKEAQLALAQSAVFRERMVAVLAHDLRNPLSSIVALAKMYARKDDVPPRAREALLQMERAAGRMVELIGTLLDVSTARSRATLPVVRVEGDLYEVARAVVEELRSFAPEREIVLRANGDTHGSWDAARMAQVVSNLVGNALTYGVPNEPITVEVGGAGDRIGLRVTNRGPAIPADELPLLFEPFRRGRDSESRGRGLGLGLYIVQQIVQAHGGETKVESSVEGETVFLVELPRRGAG